MTTITAIIAEDEAPQRRALREALAAQWPELSIVIECANGNEALQALEEHRPLIAFLDIRMPGANGLEVAKAASGRAHVVFTTAFEEYAVSAFDSGAVDYLLKPVNPLRLATALNRLKAKVNNGAPPDIADLLSKLQRQLDRGAMMPGIRWITATMGDSIKMFSIDDVFCFLADNKYTRVVTRSGEAVIRTPIRELLDGLDGDVFWRIHRGSIVRVSAIRNIQRNELGRLELQLEGLSELLNVSQSFQHRFRGM